MAEADSINTATREGVSRGVSIKSTSLRPAHTERAAPLAGNPIQLYLDFESKDLDSRGDRLDKAFAVLHLYVTAFVTDTTQQIPGRSLDPKDVNRLFVDVGSDPTVIRNAQQELRDHENWKVS
jgi:hypothetical protein